MQAGARYVYVCGVKHTTSMGDARMYYITDDSESSGYLLNGEWFPSTVPDDHTIIATITADPEKLRYTATLRDQGRMASSRQLTDMTRWMQRNLTSDSGRATRIKGELGELSGTVVPSTSVPKLGTYHGSTIGGRYIAVTPVDEDSVPDDYMWRHAETITIGRFNRTLLLRTAGLARLSQAGQGFIRARLDYNRVVIEYAMMTMPDHVLLEQLNGYRGDNIWQDIIWDRHDHTATDVVDGGYDDRFITNNGTMIIHHDDHGWRTSSVSVSHARVIDELPDSHISVIGVLLPLGDAVEYRELLSVPDGDGDHDWTVQAYLGSAEFVMVP